MLASSKCIPFEFGFQPSITPTIEPIKEETKIPSLSPTSSDIPSSLLSGTQSPESCERVSTNSKSPCIQIDTFTELKSEVENVSGTLVFCNFTVNKQPYEKLQITTDVKLICVESGGCRIRGSKRQVQISGLSARVFFQGFVFEYATNTAVHIKSSAQGTQSFCNCQFLK